MDHCVQYIRASLMDEAVLICNLCLFVGHDVRVSDTDDIGYGNCLADSRCLSVCAVYVRRLRQTVFT